MLKTYVNENEQTTVAVAEDVEMDAVMHILKVMPEISYGAEEEVGCAFGATRINMRAFTLSSALINGPIKGIVKCHEGDTYDAEVGRNEAVKKAMNNHNKAFKRALKNWQIAILKRIREVSPDTFEEAVYKVVPYKCDNCWDNEDFK